MHACLLSYCYTNMIGLYLKKFFPFWLVTFHQKDYGREGRRCHLILCLAFKESHIKSETHVLLFPPMSRFCVKISFSTIQPKITILGPYVYHGEYMSTRYELFDLVLIFLVYCFSHQCQVFMIRSVSPLPYKPCLPHLVHLLII